MYFFRSVHDTIINFSACANYSPGTSSSNGTTDCNCISDSLEEEGDTERKQYVYVSILLHAHMTVQFIIMCVCT